MDSKIELGEFSFQQTDVLGQGNFGKVFKGIEQQTGQLVAIKQIEQSKIENDQYSKKCFMNEYEILKSLDSPNIVYFYDMQETKDSYFLIQQFCNGGDVRDLLLKIGKFAQLDARQILIDVLKGFQQLLINGIIHRDMKPENLLLNNGIVQIADFGLSQPVTDVIKGRNQTGNVGTIVYMSPQIFCNQFYTSQSDIWTIGLILYELLYGGFPWDISNPYVYMKQVMENPLVFPNTVQISNQCLSFISGCLVQDEANRMNWYQVYTHPLVASEFQTFIPNLINVDTIMKRFNCSHCNVSQMIPSKVPRFLCYYCQKPNDTCTQKKKKFKIGEKFLFNNLKANMSNSMIRSKITPNQQMVNCNQCGAKQSIPPNSLCFNCFQCHAFNPINRLDVSRYMEQQKSVQPNNNKNLAPVPHFNQGNNIAPPNTNDKRMIVCPFCSQNQEIPNVPSCRCYNCQQVFNVPPPNTPTSSTANFICYNCKVTVSYQQGVSNMIKCTQCSAINQVPIA